MFNENQSARYPLYECEGLKIEAHLWHFGDCWLKRSMDFIDLGLVNAYLRIIIKLVV